MQVAASSPGGTECGGHFADPWGQFGWGSPLQRLARNKPAHKVTLLGSQERKVWSRGGTPYKRDRTHSLMGTEHVQRLLGGRSEYESHRD